MSPYAVEGLANGSHSFERAIQPAMRFKKLMVKLAANGLLVIRTSRIAGVGVVQPGRKVDGTRLGLTAGPGLNASRVRIPFIIKSKPVRFTYGCPVDASRLTHSLRLMHH